MATTLVVNPGSSSRKYALYHGGQLELEFRYESTNNGFEMCSRTAGGRQICEAVSQDDFANSFGQVAEQVKGHLFHAGPGKKLDAVAIRVVAPGTFFQQHRLIDDTYIAKLKQCESAAPLHVPTVMREVLGIRKQFPTVSLVAASDSAFHSTLPPAAREYSIDQADAQECDIHRFGYHGLSVASIVRRIHALIGRDPERLIVCHIGGGTSVSAVKNGQSVETTMGFAPATGLPMGSRAGDIDNAALLELMRRKHWRPGDAELYVNTKGGLAGLAGDADIRKLLDRRAQNDPVATHALDVFAYNIQKAIAAQTVALGGFDALVLTATASVRSTELRALVLRGLEHLGVRMSNERNEVLVGKDGVVSVRNSPVKVVVMRTDEMGEMAHIANQLINT